MSDPDIDPPPPPPNLHVQEGEVSFDRAKIERDIEWQQHRPIQPVITRVVVIDDHGMIAKRDYHSVPRIGEKFVTGAEKYVVTDVVWKNSGEPVEVRVKKLVDERLTEEVKL